MAGEYPRVGDKVRVTYEGEVTTAEDKLKRIFWMNGHAYTTKGDGNVEILERAKPKVGDKIEHRSGLKDLPVGTVVRNSKGTDLVVLRYGTRTTRTQPGGLAAADYFYSDFFDEDENDYIQAGYVIKYIPED